MQQPGFPSRPDKGNTKNDLCCRDDAQVLIDSGVQAMLVCSL